MKIHIIDPNYIFNHKYFSYLKILLFLYFYLLLSSIVFDTQYEYLIFLDDPDVKSAVALAIFLLFFILFYANMFLYTRIGTLLIDEHQLVLKKDRWEKIINLEKVKNIRIEKMREKESRLTVDGFSVDIELTKEDLNELKQSPVAARIHFEKPLLYKVLIQKTRIFSKKE